MPFFHSAHGRPSSSTKHSVSRSSRGSFRRMPERRPEYRQQHHTYVSVNRSAELLTGLSKSRGTRAGGPVTSRSLGDCNQGLPRVRCPIIKSVGHLRLDGTKPAKIRLHVTDLRSARMPTAARGLGSYSLRGPRKSTSSICACRRPLSPCETSARSATNEIRSLPCRPSRSRPNGRCNG
jgi:hypothetical protein